ncbi:MAG: aquaporin [Clostridia bacterium]|nr:aquaporin [Clostridia bacterium]
MFCMLRKFIAEFIGTATLVLFGCGTAVVTGCEVGEVSYLLTALAFGLVIVAMAYSIGNVSGCHINPAVSLAMLISKRMNVKDFLLYLGAQVSGGIVGAVLLSILVGNDGGLGANGLYDDNIVKSLLVEMILTFVFVIAILGVTNYTSNASVAGLVIGLTLTLVHIFGIFFTGTSVNPARSFGPALVQALAGDADALKVVWVFIVAPLIGAALAAVVYMTIAPDKKIKHKAK